MPLFARTTYDAQGRELTIQVYQRDGVTLVRSTTNDYDLDGNLVKTVDGVGNITKRTFDAAGRVLTEAVYQPDGFTLVTSTTKTYDRDGNLVRVEDAVHNVTTFAYDAEGHKVAMTDPLGHTATWTYDLDGNLVSTTNRNGLRIDSTYDGAGRVLTQTWYAADGVTVVDTLSFTYDPDGNLLTAANQNGTYTFTYDAQGRVLTVSEPFGVSLQFSYDLAGNRTQVVDSFGSVEQSVYDGANRLSERTFSGPGSATLRIDLTYDLSGNLVTENRFADLAGTQPVGTSTFTYDAAAQITRIAQQNGAGSIFDQFAYTYNLASQLTSGTNNGTTINYAYDASGQLTNYGSNSQSYDANGNRTNPGYVTGPDNQLLADGTWNYSYDAEGNLVKKVNIASGQTWTYGYDNVNHLIWAEQRQTDGGTLLTRVEERYDVFGNRIEEDVPTGGAALMTRFALDGWKNGANAWGQTASTVGNENWDVWADLASNNQPQTWYVHGDVVDQLFARVSASGPVGWYITDRQGSVRNVLDGSGTPIDHITYDAFGNVTAETTPNVSNRFKFQGREFVIWVGVYYNPGRFLDPETDRWLSQDQLVFTAGDPNLYRVVKNSPTDATDPSGLRAVQLVKPELESALKVVKSPAFLRVVVRASVLFDLGIAGAALSAKLNRDLGTQSYVWKWHLEESLRNRPVFKRAGVKELVELADKLGVGKEPIKITKDQNGSIGPKGHDNHTKRVIERLQGLLRDRLRIIYLVKKARAVGLAEEKIIAAQTDEELAAKIKAAEEEQEKKTKGEFWYHGTDSTETVSTKGLSIRAIVNRGKKGDAVDPDGFFVTSDKAEAILYAVTKTRVRLLDGLIPAKSYPVILRARDSIIGQYLVPVRGGSPNEKMIPRQKFRLVPKTSFERVVSP